MKEENKNKIIKMNSYIIENTFVNDDFKYAVLNNIGDYLEFKDKEKVMQEAEQALLAID